jgi:hypothetical protein
MLRKARRTNDRLYFLFGAISILCYLLVRVDLRYVALGGVASLVFGLFYVIYRIIKEWNIPPEQRP